MLNEIYHMMDCECDIKTQMKGIELAKKCEDLYLFLQPVNDSYSKNIWYNCALVLCSKSDEKLEIYLGQLLEWLQDLTWPGALLILGRLRRFSGIKLLPYFFEAVKKSWDLPDYDNTWLDNLSLLTENTDLCNHLDEFLLRELKRRYIHCMES